MYMSTIYLIVALAAGHLSSQLMILSHSHTIFRICNACCIKQIFVVEDQVVIITEW